MCWSAQRRHSTLFHNSITVLLVVKTLNTLCSFLLFNNCPPTPVTYQFLSLLRQQTRSLYETSYFLLLLLLSKGWIVTREDLTMKEFKYFIAYTIFLYILDSSVNIPRTTVFSILSSIMYLSLLFHCCYFCVRTLQGIYIQIRVSSQIRLPDMTIAFQAKKRMFSIFIVQLVSYFTCECLCHFVLIVSSLSQPTTIKYGIIDSSHEAFELIIITSMCFLYRPRCLGRYFSMNIYNFESSCQPAILPFYNTQAPFGRESSLLLLRTPSSHFLIGESVRL